MAWAPRAHRAHPEVTMTPRSTVPAAVVLAAVLSVAGCSSGTAAPGATGDAPAGAAASPTGSAPASSSAPSGAAAQPVSGGGATDFCSAYQEYRAALETDTNQQQGAGFRAAATDLRTYAPAEISAAAGLFADVMDEVGQALEAGQPAPGTLGSGQSAERRQALADSVTWIQDHCRS